MKEQIISLDGRAWTVALVKNSIAMLVAVRPHSNEKQKPVRYISERVLLDMRKEIAA